MEEKDLRIALSPLDEDHFGYRTANASYVTSENLPEVMEFSRTNKIEFLIARCSANDLDAVQSMEKEGFSLMDTLIYFKGRVPKTFYFRENRRFNHRQMKPGEEGKIKEIARESFKDYYGHYHSDARLDKTKSDEVYAKWAYQACLSQDESREVLVYEKDEAIVGFVVLEVNADGFGVPVLTGISPEHQRIGIYGVVAYSCWDWFRKKELRFSIASTQINNFRQQKYFVRFGYFPFDAIYTLHKWFD